MKAKRNEMGLSREEFNILISALNGHSPDADSMKHSNLGDYLVNGKITEAGMEALQPYKVDNAIILAAGKASRCLPYSQYASKCLFEVKGEILIERQIRQLLEAGIPSIVVVVGYQKEQLQYLKEKYGVLLIENETWQERNNVYSLWRAKDYLANSFICTADNYYEWNVFSNYVYEPYYACKHTDTYMDEYFVTTDQAGYIQATKTGGEKGWYTMGQAYFSKDVSASFVRLFSRIAGKQETFSMNWDDFHMLHCNELLLHKEEYGEEVQEFDSIEDFLKYDSQFLMHLQQRIQISEKVN